MSRNFELLDQAGRLQEMFEAPAEAPPARPLPVGDKELSISALEIEGSVREEIGKLVLNLFLLPGSQSPRQVVFTGLEAEAGCSWMCARVAEILASQTPGSVCVVDCNLRGPSLHEQFAVSNQRGLSDALLQPNPVHEYARQLARKNLYLLSAGASIENWQDQVASEGLKLRLSELRTQFDYVLLDVAPMNVSNDCIVLGSLSDGVVLVVKANSTRREAAQKALKELRSANIPTLGAVLNQRTFPIPKRIYDWL